MAIVNLDKLQASYNGNLEHVVFATDVTNGVFHIVGGLAPNQREVRTATAPTDVATQEILMHASPEVMYDPREAGLKHYVLKAGEAGRSYHFSEGDMVTITADLITGAPVVGKFLIPTNGSLKLTVANDLAGATRFGAEIIEKGKLGAENTDAYTFVVRKV
jgi:hypothetical protein